MEELAFGRSSSGRLRLQVIVTVLSAILLLLAYLPFSQAASQAPSIDWSKKYLDFQCNSIIQTEDGGYTLAGFSANHDNLGVLVNTDATGEMQWRKEYRIGDSGGSSNLVSTVQTEDPGYVLFTQGGYFIKTNAGGIVQSYTKLPLNNVHVGVPTNDGSYLLVGNSIELNVDNVASAFKVDGEGSVILNKTFTGGVTIYAVTETNDLGYALAGAWRNDFWFAKIDSNNNLQWTQTYAYGDYFDLHRVLSIAKTKDGGYILAGTGSLQDIGGFVPWLIKIDSQGHERWSLSYANVPNGVSNSFSSVLQTHDDGYLLAEGNSTVLVKTNTSGSYQWYLPYTSQDSGATHYSSSLIHTRDGGYAVAATVFDDTWLTKISAELDGLGPNISILSPENKTYDTSDIPLELIVDKSATWIGYSLDGQACLGITGNITLTDFTTITGKTTLAGLAVGEHTLVVYATDASGQIGISEVVRFKVVSRFPIELVVGAAVTAAVIIVGVLVYFKKVSLLKKGKHSFRGYLGKKHLGALANNRILWNLTIMGLCIFLILAQLFFPYVYYSSVSGGVISSFEVGVSYVYEQDEIGQIYSEVSRIREVGFRTVRINMVCDSVDINNYKNSLTEVFFSVVQQFDLKVALIINNHDTTGDVQYYLNRWGEYLSYIQILNEPELSSSWDIGALFTYDEAISKFEQIHSVVKQYHLDVQLYTNFEAGFVVRTNLPVIFSEKLDFVGYDVFMESFLTLSPSMIRLLERITNKEVVITEFGMSTNNDDAQSSFIVNGLNLFKNMGLRGCWIVYWNSAGNYYGIRGRSAEIAVGEWIAQQN
jgi:hypothetical protein